MFKGWETALGKGSRAGKGRRGEVMGGVSRIMTLIKTREIHDDIFSPYYFFLHPRKLSPPSFINQGTGKF